MAIDVGVGKLLTTSDGEYLPNFKFYEKALRKIKHLHKELSRANCLNSVCVRPFPSLW
ncbi:hypothetical protein [Saccharolobus shibatae]|uniref:hypothetical protein n=1 Tax=Saccharolobus shibatae TaxID=2286 RepID=UPI0036F44EAB